MLSDRPLLYSFHFRLKSRWDHDYKSVSSTTVVQPVLPRLNTAFPDYTLLSLTMHYFPRLCTTFPDYPLVSQTIHYFPRPSATFPDYTLLSQTMHYFPRLYMHYFPRLHTSFPDYALLSQTIHFAFPVYLQLCTGCELRPWEGFDVHQQLAGFRDASSQTCAALSLFFPD